MDVYEIHSELVKLAGKDKRPLNEAIELASGLLRLPRYRDPESGRARLVTDITDAVNRLPTKESAHAATMLKVNATQPTNWTDRVKELSIRGNTSVRGEYAFRLMAFVAHELLRIWASDAQRATDALERITYELSLEIDDKDHRKSTAHRTLNVRVAVPSQRYAALPYYFHAGPVPPKEVVALEPGQQYAGSVPDPQGSDERWWAHVIHLGRDYEFGEILTIATRERYFDKDRKFGQESPYGLHLAVSAASPAMEFIRLSVKLPGGLRSKAQPEARIAEPPLKVPYKRWSVPVQDDGWVHHTFDSDIRAGCEYGLFFPGTELYR